MTKHPNIRALSLAIVAAALVGFISPAVRAQEAATAVVPPTPPSAPAEPPPGAAPPGQEAGPAAVLTDAQLDQLLAPIALYPDPLLGHVLMASTYPGEVIDAARWASNRANRRLKGAALVNALKRRQWDPSVMALVPFRGVLEAMGANLGWTEQLGNAFLAQQADVMASVQRLRRQALEAGTLKTSPECHCIVETAGDRIAIRPTYPEVVYVPFCDPPRAYGRWRYPDHPPMSFPPPVGLAFAPGAFVAFDGVALSGYGPLWGWSALDWGRGAVTVDPLRFAAIAGAGIVLAGNLWVHNPVHRGRVLYAHPGVKGRFEGARFAAVAAAGVHGRAMPRSGKAAAGRGWQAASGPHAQGAGHFHGGGKHAKGRASFGHGGGHGGKKGGKH